MERVRWEEYKGRKILFIDYSELRAAMPAEKTTILECIQKAQAMSAQAGTKVLFLSYVLRSALDNEVMAALKDFASFTAQNAIADKECVVGVSPLQKMFVNTINIFSKAKLVIFDSLEEARDWLVS